VNIGLYQQSWAKTAAQKFCSRVGCDGLTQRMQTCLWWGHKMWFGIGTIWS